MKEKPPPSPQLDPSDLEAQHGFLYKLRFFLSHVTVEPMLLLFILSHVMSSLTSQNLNLEKACRVNLDLPVEVCDALTSRNTSGYNQEQEIAVQKLVSEVFGNQSFWFAMVWILFLGRFGVRVEEHHSESLSGGAVAVFGVLVR